MSKIYRITVSAEDAKVIEFEIIDVYNHIACEKIIQTIYTFKGRFSNEKIVSDKMNKVFCHDNKLPLPLTYYYLYTADESKIEIYKQQLLDEYKRDLLKTFNLFKDAIQTLDANVPDISMFVTRPAKIYKEIIDQNGNKNFE